MPDETAETAMRRACDLLLAGDYMSVMGELTPEALAEAMTIGAGITALPLPTAYAIDGHEETAGEHRFRVRFTTSAGEISASATWRDVAGAWKIASLGIEALP